MYKSNDDSIIENCYNTGKISGINRGYSGGIVGFYNAGAESYIKYCYNTGEVRGKEELGGIVGCYFPCTSSSGSNTLISYCYNLGNIKETTSTGGIVGRISSGQLTGTTTFANNCYFVSETASAGIGQYGNTYQKTYTASKTSIISKIVALSGYKKDSSNKNGGYPLLTWQ